MNTQNLCECLRRRNERTHERGPAAASRYSMTAPSPSTSEWGRDGCSNERIGRRRKASIRRTAIVSEWPTIQELARLLLARAFVGTNLTAEPITSGLPVIPAQSLTLALYSVLWCRRNQQKDSDSKEPECRADGGHIPVPAREGAGKEHPRRPGDERPHSEQYPGPRQRLRTLRATR